MTTAALTRPTDPTTGVPGASMLSVTHELSAPSDDDAVRRASTTAGVGLLAMSVLSAFGYLVAVKGLVIPGNAARTARNIADHGGLFRFGIFSLCLVAALDVVVAWALYRVFKPVSDALSKLAAWLRIAYAAVFMVAISQLVGGLGMHAQALRHITTFTNIWDAGLVVFGLSLFVLAYLAHRSGYVPKTLSVLLGIAGFGYVFDTVVRVLVRGSSSDVSAVTGMGEFVFAIWLVARGRRITLSDSGIYDNSTGAAR